MIVPAAVDQVAALVIVLSIAPALTGIATKTKATLGGRHGAPVLQLYYDLGKLVRKKAVYSTTTTWIFRAAPVVLLASVIAAALLLPLDGRTAPVRFAGDFIAFAGLLALGRFSLVLAGLDTGCSFEGMGASREVTFASFAEPALFLCFVGLVLATHETSLSGMLSALIGAAWLSAAASLSLVGLSLFVVLLAENSRVPIDDPATHLELTMIHEVIVLDHSGLDFALILYANAVKLALFGALLVGVFVPRATLPALAGTALLMLGLIAVAVAVGVVESVTARLRLTQVPTLLTGAAALAVCGIVLLLR